MKSSLHLTRKTYYALGMTAAALSMAGAFFVVFGRAMALLDNIAFVLTGIMFLFLASVKGSPKIEKTRYFFCFLLLLFGAGMILYIPLVNRIASGLCWPVFLWYEELREPGVRRQAIAVTAVEVLSFALWLLIVPGGVPGLELLANLVWLATTVVRAWGVQALYQKESARQAGGL